MITADYRHLSVEAEFNMYNVSLNYYGRCFWHLVYRRIYCRV